ncbi:hypothetical protein PT286_10140 [Neisseriaceae bacterium ESL0693]|nr:hypothetical protein [Neisseriaceae bacterium ESL0693]
MSSTSELTDICYIVFFSIIAFIGSVATYTICKEEKGIKNYFDLYGENRLELFIFLIKAVLGLVPVKNRLAIWVLRICYLIFISFILIVITIIFLAFLKTI